MRHYSMQLNISKNTLMSVIEAALSGLIFLSLYAFLLRQIGPDMVGLWSLISAFVSLGQAINLGIGRSLLRFVAKARAQGRTEQAVSYIETAFVTTVVFDSCLAVGLYVSGPFLLTCFVPEEKMASAIAILPYTLISFWATNLARVPFYALGGTQCMHLKSLIVIGGKLCMLGLAIALVPYHNLIGMAWAQALQSILVLSVSWVILLGQMPTLARLPRQWRLFEFREMVGYGLRLQLLGIIQMSFNTTVTILLAHFSNLGTVAYYTMAYRAVMQVRELVMAANFALVPAFTDLAERDEQRVHDLYHLTNTLAWFLSPLAIGALVSATPIISQVWLGTYEPSFIFFSIMLSIAWGINMLCAPAHFRAIGIDNLYWCFCGHIVRAVFNGVFGYAFGTIFQAEGVVLGSAIALSLGSLLSFERNHRKVFRASLQEVLTWPNISLVFSVAIASSFAIITYSTLSREWSGLLFYITAMTVPILIIAWPSWQHLGRRYLMDIMVSKVRLSKATAKS